jgi:CDP-Glycerol:Poly(glycerophosphate) glycerophosphotransferase
MQPLRVLALDHFFDQDLRALEAHPRLNVRRFPYQRFRRPAMRIMGESVARGLNAYNDPELAQARGRYAAWLEHDLHRLYLEWAFDVLVLPSDTFFYVRTLPAAAHRLGLPVVVVQKETTISQATMETFSKEVAAAAPFISDFMTVCSERQREFWTRAGSNPELIEITGQPRFDVYASSSTGPPSPRKRVLFLTYALDAYVPGAGRGDGSSTWESLRSQTETELLEQVRIGSCEVIVKCHPQQDHAAEARRLAAIAGPEWRHGFSLAAPDADTREVIMAADVVVGFQSTALYEAVAAGRTVIYAAWGDAYERYRDGLIPFDRAPVDCVRHARSAQMLATLLTEQTSPRSSGCETWYEWALGVVDGHSTDRVVERLATVAAAWSATETRRQLDGRRRRFAVGLLARSLATEVVWTAATPAAGAVGQQRRVAIRRRRAGDNRRIATRTLTGRDLSRGAG